MVPDDIHTLALKAAIAQAEGDLGRASFCWPVHPV